MRRKKTPNERVTAKPEDITPAEGTGAEEQEDSLENTPEDVSLVAAHGRKSGEHINEEGEWTGPESAKLAPAAEEEEESVIPPKELEHTDYSALEYEGLRHSETFTSENEKKEKPGGRRGASSRRKKAGEKKTA